MRITGGAYKGRKVLCPRGIIRPSMDRMRESLFAILGDLEGTSFLDLYSGSGVVGIEAASRGASPVVLVEKDHGKKKILLRNCSFVTQELRIVMMPVERFIRRREGSFDTVFLDPPFAMKGKDRILLMLDEAGLVAEEGLAILHLPREEPMPETLGDLSLCDRRRYGRSVLLFFRRL